MIFGLTTWEEMGRIDGNVLLVVNSEKDSPNVPALCDVLDRHASRSQQYVVAPALWRGWVTARGISEDRVRFAVDREGRDVELNHFLETSDALGWFTSNEIAVIVGSEAHSIYNDEIKTILEQRAALLLGDGAFLAHTLPGPYVFVFDVAGLLERMSRGSKVENYERATREIIDELHKVWTSANAVGGPASPVTAIETRLPQLAGLIRDEEERAMPATHSELTRAIAPLVTHLKALLLARDRHLEGVEAVLSRTQAEVDRRDGLLADFERTWKQDVAIRDGEIVRIMEQRNADVDIRDREIVRISEERANAVAQRDAIIADVRAELERLTSGWRRLINGKPRA